MKVKSEVESGSFMSDLCHPMGCPWNSPGQNTGVGSFSFLQGIFPTQGSKPGLPHWGHLLTYHVTDHVQITWLIMKWSPGYPALITWLITHVSRDWSCTNQWLSCTDHVTDHALITWLIMHWSRDWSGTDHVTDHALIIWLSCTDY